jgi:parvulin-like peptidyl-prolyl isomerase
MLKIMKKQLFAAAMLLPVLVTVPTRADSSKISESPRAASSDEIIEQVLVKVNGDIITKTELESRQVRVIRDRMQGKVDPESLKNDDTLKKMLAEVTPQLIVNAIDELLLLQRGREMGLRLGDDQFKQVVANIRKEQGLTDEAKFQQALAQENMTLEDLRRQLERQMLIEQVQRQEVGSKLNITEEEARQYYARHPDEFTEPASISLREIFVEVPAAEGGVNVARDDEARKKITALRERVLKGEDFAKVAAEASDSPSKANGGLIGPFARADLSPQLQQMIDSMKQGEVTTPLRTTRGYQIFKLETVKTAALQPFDSVRDLIADKVAAARTQTEMRRFLARLRSQAIIEWKNDELRKAYERQIASDTTGGA